MGSSFGQLFRISTFGESHGGAVGVILEGCPPRLPLDLAASQAELDRRRPGQSRITTPRREDDRFWASYRWGATVEFFVLDVRHERTETEIMSEAQLTWLLGALDASPCHFKVILTSVPIANLPPLWAANAESWMRFTAQRDRLLDHLVAGAHRNVLFLAGDYHVSAVWRVEDTGPRAAYHEVLCGPAGSAPSTRFALARSSDSAWQSFFPEGRIDYALDVWTATFLTFDPEADTVRVELLAGDDGRVLFDAALRHEA